MKPVAVEGAQIEHDSGSLISSGAFTITSVASTKTKVNGDGVYSTPLLYTFSGGNAAGFVPGSIATVTPQSIVSSAAYTKENGLLVMLEDDSATMNCIGTPTGGGSSPITGPVIIGNAGQTKVEAE
jgi:hypothetical protein